MAEANMPKRPYIRKAAIIVCADCGVEVVARTGTRKRCEPCATKRTKQKNRESARRWALDHPEAVSPDARRQRYQDRIEVERARGREAYRRNSTKAIERAKEHYRKNRAAVLARMATPEGRQYAAAKMRERREKNPQFKLHSNTSRAIRKAIGGKGGRRWEELVGYTAEELKLHIERQFVRGMGWRNYGKGAGKWHIDHIVPQSAFSFTSPDDPDFRACWALTNLRPLWGDKNISKHASREFLL